MNLARRDHGRLQAGRRDGDLINSPVFRQARNCPGSQVTFSDASQRIEAEQALERALQHEKELGELKVALSSP
ncbi:MAG: hypothetical protein R2856_07845 [Caldilineaceae bacterium]